MDNFVDARQPAAVNCYEDIDTAVDAGMPAEHPSTGNSNKFIRFELEPRQPAVHHPQDETETTITMVIYPSVPHRLQKPLLKTPLDETGPNKPDELVL